jgi:hypothetical protein
MTLENRKKLLAHYKWTGNKEAELDLLKKYPDTEEKKKEEPKKEKPKNSK